MLADAPAAGALVLGGSIAGLLVGIEPTDPFTYALVIGIVAVVTLLAAVIPARRVATIDPVVAFAGRVTTKRASSGDDVVGLPGSAAGDRLDGSGAEIDAAYPSRRASRTRSVWRARGSVAEAGPNSQNHW